MLRTTRLRLFTFIAGATTLAATATVSSLPASASESATVSPASDPVATGTPMPPEWPPTNAAKIFRWGDSLWHDGFIGPINNKLWSVNHPSLVANRYGMLTLMGTADSGTVSARVTDHGARFGRWEARVRTSHAGTGGTPYRVVWELVPTHRYHCGARTIGLADYTFGAGRAHMYLRNLPNRQYTYSKRLDLSPGPFHTYAVEVTRHHISWFVDTHVLMTERREAARTGASYNVRFRLVGAEGATMRPVWMQMDWVRYYTLERKNARSIDAPQAHAGTYADAC